ncbi:MAG: adenylate kinase [Treponema sp.]|nr:MAG: adenylate kinase [Treponema sp.]
MKLIFLGPPGAGKGTLAFDVAKFYDIPHISTGSIFRVAIKEKTELGLKVKSIIESGGLVDDELTVALVKDRLQQDDCKKGFILDGFPRTIPQAEAFQKIMNVRSVVNFEIDDDEVISRLSSRRTCPKCGQTFNLLTLKPKKEGICDSCDVELFIRKDDQPETIKSRLEVYRAQTEPLIGYYRKQGKIIDIDARPTADVVFQEFKKHFPKN